MSCHWNEVFAPAYMFSVTCCLWGYSCHLIGITCHAMNEMVMQVVINAKACMHAHVKACDDMFS